MFEACSQVFLQVQDKFILISLITDSLCMFVFLFEQKKVTLNTFLDTLMSDPPPQCLVWLPLLHRLANVENGK